MNSSQFDRVARLFADRKLSRRQAMTLGSGLAAAGLMGPTAPEATAQDATATAAPPSASPATPGAETDKPSFLFVQIFGAGSLAPKTGDEGVLTLTADHLTGQTIFFSDRPERIVGTVPTERFLGLARNPAGIPQEGLGFTPADPPNAALIFDSAAGSDEPGDVVVVELINPTYDRTTGLATYEVAVLADETAVDLSFVAEPVTAAAAIRSFAGASLFIDDCNDGDIICVNETTGARTTIVSSLEPTGYCWDAGLLCSAPCAGMSSWQQQCYDQVYSCGGGDACYATFDWQVFYCAPPTSDDEAF